MIRIKKNGRNEELTVDTALNIKRAGVKKVIRKGGAATGIMAKKVLQWVLNTVLTLLLIFTVSGIIIGVTFFNYVRTYLIEEDFDIENLKNNLDQTTKIFCENENGEYFEIEDQRIYGTENRSWVSYSAMPKHLVDSFIAIEDERFWEHNGVDWKRTIGAVLEFAGGNDSYGGSTITQQLIKNITEEDDTTIQRKVKEIFRALSLTKKRSRNEIIEMYLNTISLGRNNYGVQAAANYYFGKDVSELTLIECAALASIPKSPTKYDPVRNPQFNAERRALVLDKMAELEWASKEDVERAKEEELVINITVLDGTVSKSNSYFKDALIEEIISDLMEEYGYSRTYASNIIYSGGLEIYSTMDPDVQAAMEEVFYNPESFQKVQEGIQPESAMVVMDPYTGDVKGLVGGRKKTGDRDLNRATMSKRQIGSSIKPLTVYAPAMDLGIINYATVYDDTPFKYMESLKRYWPVNAPQRYDGLTTINRAVEVSKNTVAVKVLNDISTDYSYNFAKNKLHLDNLVESDKDLAPLAMGGLTHGLSVLEVTAAYSIFPNGGEYSAPRMYTKVLRSDGTVLLEKNIEQEYAISSETAQVMTKILSNVVTSGTAAAINLDNKINVAGKTGSTNEDKDRYFAGFTPYYVGACWFGYDTPKYLGKFSSNPAMLAWEKVMDKIHKKYIDASKNGGPALKKFDYSDLKEVSICLDSGLRPGDYCGYDLRGGRIAKAWFTKSQLPTGTCTTHTLLNFDSTTKTLATNACPIETVTAAAFIRVTDRVFTENIEITDARYTCIDIPYDFTGAEYIYGAYYSPSLPEGTFCGFSPKAEIQENSFCKVHTYVPPVVEPENTDIVPPVDGVIADGTTETPGVDILPPENTDIVPGAEAGTLPPVDTNAHSNASEISPEQGNTSVPSIESTVQPGVGVITPENITNEVVPAA